MDHRIALCWLSYQEIYQRFYFLPQLPTSLHAHVRAHMRVCMYASLQECIYLLWFCLHQCQHAVLMVLKVGVEQWRPSSVVPAVHLVPVGDESLQALQPSRQGSQMEGCGPFIVLQPAPVCDNSIAVLSDTHLAIDACTCFYQNSQARTITSVHSMHQTCVS